MRWVGSSNGSSVQQGLLQPCISPFSDNDLHHDLRKNHLIKRRLVLVQEFWPEMNLGLFWVERFAWRSYPDAVRWVCFFPWVFLVISDSTSCASFRECALPVIPRGYTGGMGTPICHCHESWQVLLDLILRGCLQNLCFCKTLVQMLSLTTSVSFHLQKGRLKS